MPIAHLAQSMAELHGCYGVDNTRGSLLDIKPTNFEKINDESLEVHIVVRSRGIIAFAHFLFNNHPNWEMHASAGRIMQIERENIRNTLKISGEVN